MFLGFEKCLILSRFDESLIHRKGAEAQTTTRNQSVAQRWVADAENLHLLA
jgi:hypothetical protein